MPRKMRKTWYSSASQRGEPSSFVNTLTQATKKSVDPKLTASVIVIWPTTYSHPQIQLARRRHDAGAIMKVW